MAAGVLLLFADDLPDPFLELRLRQVVVVNPALVAGVVRRVNVDALDAPGMRRQQRLQRQEIIALDDQVSVQRRLLAFAQDREFGIKIECVMRYGVVIRLHRRFAFELQCGHGLKRSRVVQPCRGWLLFRGGSPCLKKKGRDLITLLHRHGGAHYGTLSGTPEWACLQAPSVVFETPVS